jgi:hypothetical protein
MSIGFLIFDERKGADFLGSIVLILVGGLNIFYARNYISENELLNNDEIEESQNVVLENK